MERSQEMKNQMTTNFGETWAKFSAIIFESILENFIRYLWFWLGIRVQGGSLDRLKYGLWLKLEVRCRKTQRPRMNPAKVTDFR